MLILWDIDGTLMDTGGAGMSSLRQAITAVFQCDGPELNLAGATDSSLFLEICQHTNTLPTEELSRVFWSTYLEFLHDLLPKFPAKLLPGVLPALESLAPHAQHSLLTGNIRAGAHAKLSHFQINHFFVAGAFGDDHPNRNHLGPIALNRVNSLTGKTFTPEQTLVIGDTPKDIFAARALGARCIAVATGHFSTRQLAAAGADLALPSLDLPNLHQTLSALIST